MDIGRMLTRLDWWGSVNLPPFLYVTLAIPALILFIIYVMIVKFFVPKRFQRKLGLEF